MSLATHAASAAGDGLGLLFTAVGKVRRGRGLHPQGKLHRGTLTRHGLRPPTGVPWLDEPGRDGVLVRFSRGAGLPRRLPDLLGLAVRIPSAGAGGPADLLLSGAGRAPGLRHVLRLQRDPRRGTYTSVVPFRTPSGLLMVGAFPSAGGFALQVAPPAGTWRTFGRLDVGEAPDEDSGLPFDPMLRPIPGLRMPETLTRLREPAYRASRRTRPGSGE